MDGNWENPLNWNGDAVPLSTEDVILDNSISSLSYDVFISGSAGSIGCHSLVIAPASSHSIRLFIPSSNLLTTAFFTTGTGYTIQLRDGAVLINGSGATTGTVLSIADSMKIETGGRYIHRTPRGNAVIMNTISSAAGTENGVVEFDVPVVSGSYIVSLTNRNFGTLVFSSNANKGNITYTSNGSNHVLIRGDLTINAQVSLSVGFNDTIHVKGKFLHQGNVFNLSNNGNPTVLQLDGDLMVNSGSSLTETNTAQPVILFSGNTNQDCDVQGNIANEIVFKIQKKASLILSAPLTIPFNLELRKGIIKTDSMNLLTLSSVSRIVTDSLLIDSAYIDGPVRKLGLASTDHFFFPVGKVPRMRWLELKNASGDFTVEFVKSNPYGLASAMADVDHISRIEYWTIQSSSSASANVELSFDNVNSGGVTDLSSLSVAQLSNNWLNQGNTGTTGSAGAAGSVVSNLLFDFTNPHRFFTLAGIVSSQNPLPFRPIVLSFKVATDQIDFEWHINPDLTVQKFILEYSLEKFSYYNVQQVFFQKGVSAYHFHSLSIEPGWYRVRGVTDNEIYFSNIIHVASADESLHLQCANSIHSNQLLYSINSRDNGNLVIQLVNGNGELVAEKELRVKRGQQRLTWNIASHLPNGIYFLSCYSDKYRSNIVRILKE